VNQQAFDVSGLRFTPSMLAPGSPSRRTFVVIQELVLKRIIISPTGNTAVAASRFAAD
jgi:hypothetical protein